MEESEAPAPAGGDDARLRRAPRAGDTGATRLMEGADLAFAPASYDADAGTVDVVWSTGAAVLRTDWWTGERYFEVLDLNGADLTRLNAGAPLLLDHWSSVDNVAGSIVPGSARVENGRGVATIRFDRSGEAGRMAEAKVAGGHLRHVSIGYRVTQWEKHEKTTGQPARWIARAWEPFEVSLVPVPADAGAGMRAAGGATSSGAGSPPSIATRAGAAARNPEVLMVETENPGATAPEPTPEPVESRAAAPAAPAAATLPELEAIAARAGLGADFVLAQLRAGATADAAKDAALDAVAARRGGPVAVVTARPSGDDPAVVRDALADAIAVRATHGRYKPQSERFREYASFDLSELVREAMAARGERNLPRSRVEVAERAMHTTSDFPLLLSSALNKVLLADYALAAPTYRAFMARRTFNDFRAHSFLRVGDFPTLLAVNEHGEIKAGTISEGREQVTIATYGRSIRVTRQLLVNDDLGAFGDFANMVGRRVADFENATAFAVLNTASGAGPNLEDGTAVFSTAASRANKASSGGAIDVTSLSTGRAAMRKQTSPDGLKLNLTPRILLTGPAYETTAEQILASVTPTKAGDVNPFSGRLTPVADANITGNAWYLFADPAVAPVYIYGYLAGAEGPRVSSGPVQGFDGFQVEVLLDFGVGAIDFRGGWFNPGA